MIHIQKIPGEWRIAYCGKRPEIDKQKDGVLVFSARTFGQSLELPNGKNQQRTCKKCLSHYRELLHE